MHTAEGQHRQKKQENRMHKAFLDRGLTPDYGGGEGKNPNQTVDLSCIGGTRAYPDFTFQLEHMLVFGECDEHWHSDRMLSCETKRMTEIQTVQIMGGEKRPIVFLRINPDSFTVDGEKKKVLYEKRMDDVVDFVKKFKPEKDLTIAYFFFPVCKFPGTKHRYPEILKDPDFPEELKKCVKCVY